MGANTLLRDPVKVWRAAAVTDAYGSVKRDWNAKTVVAQGVGSVQPVFSFESINDRQTTTEQLRLIATDPALDVIEPYDRIEWRGRFLEVDSAAQVYVMRGQRHHIEVNLRYVEG